MIEHQVAEYLKRNGPDVAAFIKKLTAKWVAMDQEEQLEIKQLVNTALYYDQVKDRIAWTNFLNCVS